MGLVRFGRIARIALVSATICMTVGASGVLATMTWQVPGEASAAPEVAADAAATPVPRSLVMTAAQDYIDTRSAKLALQAAPPRTTAANVASSKAAAAPSKDMASFAQFERRCLKKVSKRRNAKLVHVPCSPLQGAPSQSASLTNEKSATR